MPLKTLIATLVLSGLPVFAAAQCVGEHSQASISCAEGTQWDETSGTCVAPATG